MANEEHLKILKQGVEQWNKWRLENSIESDLSGAVSRFLGKYESSTKFAVRSMVLSLLAAVVRKDCILQGTSSLACAIAASVVTRAGSPRRGW